MRNDRGMSLIELVMMIAIGGVLIVGLSSGIRNQLKAAIDLRASSMTAQGDNCNG